MENLPPDMPSRPPLSPSSTTSSRSREEVCSSSESPLHLPPQGWGGHIRRPHWESVPDPLKGIDLSFPMDILEDPILSIPPEKQATMDGTSKCWRSIAPTSESLLHQEPDGITWAICEECVTQIPLEIQHAIFFFHSLKGHIQDYSGYSIESKNISFRMDRKRPKVVTKLLWSMTDEIRAHDMGNQYNISENEDIDMTSEMQQRSVYQDGTMYREVNPVKIRLAFTGVKFKRQEDCEKRVFAVLLVTFARNFDALEYIKEVFLREPGHSESNYQKKHDFYNEMKLIWKRMLRFVAFDNLGLNEARLGKPEDYLDNPGGILGTDSLMNMFQIPLQIYGSLKKSVQGGFQDLEIMGMPYLTFKRDDITQDYLTYMHRYVNCLVKARRQVSKGIKQLALKNAEKKRKNGGDLEDIEERNDLSQQEDSDGEDTMGPNKELFCTGGWPLEKEEEVIVSWGLPKLPLYLQFEAEFTPDINSHFNYWIVDAGGPNGIPEVTKACLRFYLVSGDSSGGAGSGDQVHWEHFLHDPRPANPSLVLKEFYGEKANPMSAVVVAGHLRSWWKSLSQDFLDVPPSARDVSSLYEKYKRYLKSVILHHESSVSCNAYRSERVVQAMQIIQKLDWKSISHQGPDCILKRMKEARGKLPFTRRHDHYQVTNELFWRTWEELNLSFKMNSSNLSFLIEMMISQVFWMMGEHNETWAAYFQGIQIKSGNGHYKITTKEGTMDDQRKPNSSGMDWTHGRLSDLYQVILDRFGCSDPKQNLQTPINCLGWTPASIPLLTHATIVDGKIDTLPDSMIALRSIVTTEIRGNGTNIESLISNFPRNADGLDQLKLNTCDPENTNKRKARIQKKFHPLHIVALSSNCPARSEKDNEEYRTLGAVLHVLVPGSAGYVKRRKVGDFNNQVCNAFGGRQCKPDNIDSIANILSFSNIWVSCMGALINKSAAIPWEINPAVLSYLDWLFFYVKEHCDGLLDKFVLQSFRRMKEGYESRQVAKSVWTCAIRDIALSPEGEKDHYQAVMNNLQSLHVHALPVCEVPASAHSFLTRGIHMGSTMIIGVCARHLDVPVLKTEDLQAFFTPKSGDDTPITDRERQCLRTLRQWIEMSSERFRFCVDETGQKTCYISSDADMYQNPLDDKICMLRVKKSRVYHDNVYQAMGVRVKDLFGSELNETCHMGPEPSIYGNAVQGLVQDWTWDFRQLFCNTIFHSQQHLIKLGLAGQFPGIVNWTENETPSFAKVFVTKDPHGEVMSYSLGLNVWALLLFVSMGGSLLHPHATSNLSRAILKQILENAPESATPGNTLMVRSFNIETTSPQRILLTSKRRPRHFVRALGDLSFATTGTFTYGKDVDGFLPEDVMHNGFLFPMAKMFGCHILDIPGQAVKAGYEIMANTVYACWKACDRQLAYLKVQVNAQVQHVILHNYETSQVHQFSLEEWESQLKELDYTILPMIFRRGACLKRPDDPALLGVIVPYPGQQESGDSSENFNPEEGTYHYISSPTLEIKGIPCIDALTHLVQVGSVVYLDLTSDSARPLLPKLSASESQCQYLQARLSPPACLYPTNPSKVWITYTQKPSSVTASASASSCSTIEVDPWEVRLTLPGNFQEGARVVAHAVYV